MHSKVNYSLNPHYALENILLIMNGIRGPPYIGFNFHYEILLHNVG